MKGFNFYYFLYYKFLRFFRTFLNEKNSDTSETIASGILALFISANLMLLYYILSDYGIFEFSKKTVGLIWLISVVFLFVYNFYFFEYKEKCILIYKHYKKYNDIFTSLIVLAWFIAVVYFINEHVMSKLHN